MKIWAVYVKDDDRKRTVKNHDTFNHSQIVLSITTQQ